MTTILEFAAKEPFLAFVAVIFAFWAFAAILDTIKVIFRGYPPESTTTTTETETTKTTLD